MKKYVVLLALTLLVGCAAVPDVVKQAHRQQQESLANFNKNAQGFTDAAFGDLEIALIAQLDAQMLEREVELLDADGKVVLEHYKKELAEYKKAVAEQKATTAKQTTRYKRMLVDLDNAIAIGEALGEYLNRDAFTADDVAALLEEIRIIVGGH